MTSQAISATDANRALDSDDDAIIAAAAKVLPQGETEWEDDGHGDAAGVTYRDDGTGLYYAADIDDCRALLELVAAGESDAYSLWCSDQGHAGHATRDGARCEVV